MALFAERGFESTTVAEIAARAGLTERTFFRHFGDKREVLFGGAVHLRDLMVGAVAGAPPSATPMHAVTAALDAAGELFQLRRAHARQRYALILASTELQERELIKLASLAVALAEALREREVAPATASLTAEAGIAVFRVAFEQWVTGDDERDLTACMHDSLAELRAATA